MSVSSPRNAADMRRINGKGLGDRQLAKEFSERMLSEANSRKQKIDDYCDVKIILDKNGLNTIDDCLTGITHLFKTVNSLAEFHKNGELSEIFGNLLDDLMGIRKEAIKNAALLKNY